eukprot:1586646-Rhodomonas_salina.1
MYFASEVQQCTQRNDFGCSFLVQDAFAFGPHDYWSAIDVDSGKGACCGWYLHGSWDDALQKDIGFP